MKMNTTNLKFDWKDLDFWSKYFETSTLSVIFPTYWPQSMDAYRNYGAMEVRSLEVVKNFAKLGCQVNVLAPKGSHLPIKNVKVLTGDYGPWGGSGVHPYNLEKNLVECNLDALKASDAVLDDTHFRLWSYLKSKHPDEYPHSAFSFDFHCFVGRTKIRTFSENGHISIRKINDLEHEGNTLVCKNHTMNGEWFKQELKTPIYRIELINRFELEGVTTDHLHLTLDGLKRTDELDENDFLPISLYKFGGMLGTYELGWVIGFIGAEGSFNTKDIAGQGISISQTGSDEGKGNLLRCKKFVEEQGHYCNLSQNHRGEYVLVISRTFLPIAQSFIGGKNALTKNLKNKVWNTAEEFRRGMWDGWYEGDRNGRSIGTYSKILVYDLAILLRSLGILASIQICTKSDPKLNTCYNAYPYKKTKHGKYQLRGIEQDKDDENIVWVKINKIEEVKNPKREYVYDFTVDSEDHLFELGNGIITHNCDQISTLPLYPQNIIAVSKWLLSALREKFKNQGHKFWHAYSGLIRNNYPSEFDPSLIENDLYLFLCRFSNVKSPAFILELAKDNPDNRFVMMGDVAFSNEPHYAMAIKNIADKMPNVKVIFNASYEEKIDYLQRSVGLLHPGSWNGPLEWDMLEGLYFGSKILAFDRGAAREIYRNKEHGIIAPFTNNEAQNIEIYKRAFKMYKKLDIKPEDCRQRVLDFFDFEVNSFPKYVDVLFPQKKSKS